MKRLMQRTHGQDGDCLSTSVASILEIDREAIPNFVDLAVNCDSPAWPITVQKELLKIGYCIIPVHYTGSGSQAREISDACTDTNGYFIGIGKNIAGTDLHANVHNGSGFIHDPSGYDNDCIKTYHSAYCLVNTNNITRAPYQLELDLEQK